eukprot:c15561_g1_i1.p1 GENE.c15561_g1_i1~~c15561_g1_i1.p1  ORF type:complete len:437 (+),score=103.73 c15561_g1_i1:27-1313(+)
MIDFEAISDEGLRLFLQVAVFLISFVGLAIVCGDHLVKALETLCVRWGIREDVAGASFMAFGNAAPEIIINAISALKSHTAEDTRAVDLGLGAIMGSGMIAFSLIPGVCGLCSKIPMTIKRRPLFRDMMFYAVSISTVIIALRDGQITTLEGGLLSLIYVVYVAVVYVAAPARNLYRRTRGLKVRRANEKHFVVEQREADEAENLRDARLARALSYNALPGETPEPSILQRIWEFLGKIGDLLTWPLRTIFWLTCPACGDGERFEKFYPVTFIIAFAWVSFFSYLIADVVESWGSSSNIPLSFLGVVVVAIGAEIPDMIQSVTVAQKGYGSMAVAGCFGSQITNVCVGLGVPWLLAGAAFGNVKVSGRREIERAMYFLGAIVGITAVLLLGFAVVLRSDKIELGRWKGVVLTGVYVASIAGFSTLVLT